MKNYILIALTMIIFIGCGSTTTLVHSYRTSFIDTHNIKNIELNVIGSELLKSKIKSITPIYIANKELLILRDGSETLLEVKVLDKSSTFNKYENTKTDYNYKLNGKKNSNKYLKYNEYCLDTTYFLRANLKLINRDGTFVNKDFFSTVSNTQCKDNKYEIRKAYELKINNKKNKLLRTVKYKDNKNIIIINNIYNNQVQKQITPSTIINDSINRIHNINSLEYNSFYNNLTNKLANNIVSYLVPKRVSYHVQIEDKLDIEINDIDNEIFENTIELLEKRKSKYILESLIKLETKYPSSYTIKYNIGVYYEKNEENTKALKYYEQAINIKITELVLKRINKVKLNETNIAILNK